MFPRITFKSERNAVPRSQLNLTLCPHSFLRRGDTCAWQLDGAVYINPACKVIRYDEYRSRASRCDVARVS